MGSAKSGNYSLKYRQMEIGDIVTASIGLVNRYIKDEAIPVKDRVEVAARFALKYMPERVTHTHTILQLSNETAERILNMLNNHVSRGTSDNKCIEILPIEPKSLSHNELEKDGSSNVL